MGATNDNSVVVSIIGDASGVRPAVEATKADLGGLKSSVEGVASGMRGFGSQSGSAFKSVETAVINLTHKIHESAESVRTFQARAREFAEIYVAMFAVDKVVEFIAHMAEGAERVEHLSQEFGLTRGEVQRLGGVAAATGVSIDTLVRGMSALDRNLANAAMGAKNVEQAMKAVGLSFNDGRSQMDKLLVVADKFKNMEDGPKKAALAMNLFGRSGVALVPILNLGSQGIEALNAKMAQYGVVNAQAVEKGVALAESVNETKIGFMGVGNVLAQALAPAFKQVVDGVNLLIAAFIASYREGGIARVVLDGIGVAIRILVDLVETLGAIFSEVWGTISDVLGELKSLAADVFGNSIPSDISYASQALEAFRDLLTIIKDAIGIFAAVVGGLFKEVGATVVLFGKIAYEALTLNWGAIDDTWAQGLDNIRKMVDQTAADVAAKGREMAAAFNGTLKYPEPKGIPLPKGGVGGFDYSPHAGGHKGKQGPSLAERLEAELEAKKTAWAKEQDAQGTFQRFSLQAEADFWAEALKRANLGLKDKLAIERKWLAARQALKREEIEAQLDGYQQDLDAAGANSDAKLAILRNELAYVVRMYGAESKEARRAGEDIVRAEREKAAQMRELEGQISKAKEDAALAGVDEAEAAAQFEVEIGRRGERQLLAQERQFESERFQIKRKALLDSLRLAALDPTSSPAKLRDIHNQIEALERQHQAKLTQIDRQAALQRTQIQRSAINQVASAFGDHIAKMITLQEGWREGLIGIYQSLVLTVASVVQQIVEKWVAAFLTKLILGKQEAAQNVASHVGEAGAGGVASMAAAPFPINLSAPAFGASMAAAAASFGSVASAEGGDWHVREGMYQLHKDEMVLPAWAAGSLRSMLGGGRGGGDATKSSGGRGDANFHYSPTINHHDASWERLMRRNGREARRWFRNQARNGSLMPPAS